MVEDYLSLLKSKREQPLQFTIVDLGRLARAAFDEIALMPGQKPARFVCGSLPQASGDAVLLRQLVVNLIGNALKYSAKRDVPVVEVGAVPGEDFHTFFVRDNGAGLDLARATRLFEPFQRFHSASDFPGTGVGLAIVKRILERHGGRVWVESQVDAGATFFFTVPVKPASVTLPTGVSRTAQ